MLFRFGILLLLFVAYSITGYGSHNPLHNTSSLEFRALANDTYKRLTPCIKSWMIKGSRLRNLSYPLDAEQHFADIKRLTMNWTFGPTHSYANYSGPWIENRFIERYYDAPLHTFRGLIPIFVQWVDSQLLYRFHYDVVRQILKKILRPNVLYVTVSQGAEGIYKVARRHPNVLVFSAGGFGHVPIPLIKSEITARPIPQEYEQDIGFFGTPKPVIRVAMLDTINATAKLLGMTYKQEKGENWTHNMEYTKFNLVPRGFGRTSYRFVECIQMGRIPVFLFDDVPWIPYHGTNSSLTNFGFMSTNSTTRLRELVHHLKYLDEVHYHGKLEALKRVRHHYTYEGVLEQMDSFFKDPLGPQGGDLRCVKHPKTTTCCDIPPRNQK